MVTGLGSPDVWHLAQGCGRHLFPAPSEEVT